MRRSSGQKNQGNEVKQRPLLGGRQESMKAEALSRARRSAAQPCIRHERIPSGNRRYGIGFLISKSSVRERMILVAREKSACSVTLLEPR